MYIHEKIICTMKTESSGPLTDYILVQEMEDMVSWRGMKRQGWIMNSSICPYCIVPNFRGATFLRI